MATGQAAPDMPWSLGAAWRAIYPALVELVNHGGMAPTAWPMFRSITTELERLSFGPPASNAGRILALIEAEIIDLSRLTASTYQPDPPSDRVTRRRSANTPEYKIDAVIPSPHHVNPQGPLQYLEDAGIIQRAPGARGISVDECGAPLNSAKRARGISVLGRATEGCILGNDSLSRSLDPHPESWSRRVVERIRKRVFKHG